MSELLTERWMQLAFAEDSTTVRLDEAHGNSKIYDKCQKGWKKHPDVAKGEMARNAKGSCIPETDEHHNEADELMETDEQDEGNAFSGARQEAIDNEEDEFEVDGEKYKVTGDKTKSMSESHLRRIIRNAILEACYDGKKVTLNSPSSNSENPNKKSKVYVKGKGKYKSGPCKGQNKAKKVQFGDPNMRIRKSNPKARSNFRKRHKCHEKKPKDSAGYWSCKAW